MKRVTEVGTMFELFFNRIGGFCWPNITVGVWDAKKRVYRLPIKNVKGAPDWFANWNSRFICIEIKTSDRMSEDQTKFMVNIIRTGGIYFIIRNYDDLISSFQFYGIDPLKSEFVRSLNSTMPFRAELPNINLVAQLKIRYNQSNFNQVEWNHLTNVFKTHIYKIVED